MTDTFKYIIQFLLGEELSSDIVEQVGYTSDENEFGNYKLVIQPSGFFDKDVYATPASLPSLPLKIWEETPILFGEPTVENTEITRILKADLVASTYFLISRYEEMVSKNIRDDHGRFPGKASLPYRAGFIDRPLVDEYGRLLRQQLRETGIEVPEPPKQIKKVYITHDVDHIAHFRDVKGLLGGLIRSLKRPKEGPKAMKSFFGGLRFDPWYTFPFLFNIDTELRTKLTPERCEIITFIRSGGSKYKQDKPAANLIHPDYKNLFRYCKRKNISLGLHASYEVGIHPYYITDEKNKLERLTKTPINYNRNHYLTSREPMDMLSLIAAGITDDFTMGYADMAGFRLGTCRPVKYIDLKNMQVTGLTLHSLPVMDRTLSDKRYMYMNAHDAFQYCTQLIDNVEQYNGEIALLWHNNTVEKNADNYHRKLYRDILKYLHDK